MTLWPFPPRVPTTEKLVFNTDVMQTPEQERRVSLRPARLEMLHTYLFDEANDARAQDLFRSNPLGDWEVPQWTEWTEFPAPLLAGSTTIPANTSADYRVGGQVYLSSSYGLGQARTIATIGTNTLTVTEPTTMVTFGAAPVRLAYCVEGLGGARRFKGLTDRSMKFVTRDWIDLAATPFSQLAGFDVMSDPTVTVTPLLDTVFQAATYIDNGQGPVAVEEMRDILEGRAQLVFMDKTPAERWRRKRWIHYIRGKEKAFWVPTWTDDFTLAATASAASTNIDVEPLDGLPTSYIGKALMIDDGNKLFRTINNAIAIDGVWRFSLSSALGRTISSARISLMKKYRADTDEFEIVQEHHVFAETSFTCLEVPA